MNANNISSGNTPNSNHLHGSYDTPPPIRNEYDVLSCALHQHGYWPDRSLIILTATDNTLGPSLRVNLPDEPCPHSERADFLHETFTKLPTCHNGETLTRFYAIIIDGDNTVRQRQLHPKTAQLAAIEEIQQDVDTQTPINAWLHLLHDPRIVSELRCEDVIYAGGASIWALNPEQQALTLLAPIEEIRHSNYYTWLTRHGDTIADTAQHNYAHSPWDTDPTTNPETRHDWENAVELWDQTHTTRHDEARQSIRTIYRQAQIDLCYWDAAINAAAHLLATHPIDNTGNPTTSDVPTIGDTLRELIPAEVAGHLRASIAPVTLNPITAEMLTYLASYRLNHAQKALAYLHYSAQYTYHAFGGEYPSTSPNPAPLEPPHYGTRITRKTYIPASFTHALSTAPGIEQAYVRAVPENACNGKTGSAAPTVLSNRAALVSRTAASSTPTSTTGHSKTSPPPTTPAPPNSMPSAATCSRASTNTPTTTTNSKTSNNESTKAAPPANTSPNTTPPTPTTSMPSKEN